MLVKDQDCKAKRSEPHKSGIRYILVSAAAGPKTPHERSVGLGAETKTLSFGCRPASCLTASSASVLYDPLRVTPNNGKY